MTGDVKDAIAKFRQVLEAADRSNNSTGREAMLMGLLLEINQALVDLIDNVEKNQKAVWEFEAPGPTGVMTKMKLRRLQ